jgi:hypothetical protein
MSTVSSPRPAVKTTRKPRQRRRHERSVKTLLPAMPAAGIGITLVRITQDGESQSYWVKPLRSDFGLAYRLEKDGAEPGAEDTSYDALLEIEGDTCTCPGHTYGGYCKHVDCLRALHTRGLLPLPPVDAVMPDEADLPEACGQCCDPDTPF